MNYQMLILAFAVVVITNIHCQAKPQQEESDKGQVVSSKQVRKCICNGRRNAVEQNCPCELLRQYRNKERALCQKKGPVMSKKCKQLTGGNRKEKKSKGISTPI